MTNWPEQKVRTLGAPTRRLEVRDTMCRCGTAAPSLTLPRLAREGTGWDNGH